MSQLKRFALYELQVLQSMGALVWDGGTLIRIMDESRDAHGLQEIKVFAARLVHYPPKRTSGVSPHLNRSHE